jgi:hypothetical protein
MAFEVPATQLPLRSTHLFRLRERVHAMRLRRQSADPFDLHVFGADDKMAFLRRWRALPQIGALRVTKAKDFIAFNVPGMLSRKVTIYDNADPTIGRRDDGWYERVATRYRAVSEFFATNELLRNPEKLPTADQMVLRLSDFTALGQEFVMSGAADRWLASFDRPGSKKKLTDVTYLEKQLLKLRTR